MKSTALIALVAMVSGCHAEKVCMPTNDYGYRQAFDSYGYGIIAPRTERVRRFECVDSTSEWWPVPA